MNHLTLQVGEIHVIRVRNANSAHSGRRQVQCSGRAQTARPDDQDFRFEDFDLAFNANVFQ